MKKFIIKNNKFLLVALSTSVSVVFTLIILVVIFSEMQEQIRLADVIVAITAPLLIASLVTWYLFSLIADISAQEKKMRELATYDHLSQCLSKKVFLDQVTKAIENTKEMGSSFALLMIDIDFFKKINDKFGHVAGDCIIKKFAQILIDNSRHSDIVGRYGGDEFMIFVRDTNQESILTFADILRKKVESAEFTFEGKTIRLTTSIGLHLCDASNNDVANLSELIQQTDLALYESKHMGRNTVSSFSALNHGVS